ncbi:MAG: PEP-CTERM sorting domain-containing protein [Methylococcaceae bacterium]|nr:PEP-CTERM sorting domain-containing protein [Methylococcaceae bacterium]
MTKITQILRTLPLLVLAVAANTAHASTIVAPNAYDATAGNVANNTAINSSARTYEMQIAASQLAGMAVGSSINGLAWRLASNEPAASGVRNWSDFEITLGQAANTIAGMSTTFAANLLNPVLVRDGALSYDLSGFSNAGTPKPFAPSISFFTPYTYLGGDLVVLISHSIATGGTNSFLDALNTAAAGYGSDFKALSASTFNASTGNQQSFAITQFDFTTASTAVPEPEFMALVGIGMLGLMARRRKLA